MKSRKSQTWVMLLVLVASVICGWLGYTYLEENGFKAANSQADENDKYRQRAMDFDGRLSQLSADYERQQAQISDLSRRISDARTTIWLDHALIAFCLNSSNQQTFGLCAQTTAKIPAP
jgi:hypothetical protein